MVLERLIFRQNGRLEKKPTNLIQNQKEINQWFYTLIGHRQGFPKIGIVITDGGSDNQGKTLVEAKKARDSGIKMIAVGVGKSVNQAELEGIANKPTSQYVFNVDSFDVLHTIQAILSTLTCAAGSAYIFILLYSSA